MLGTDRTRLLDQDAERRLFDTILTIAQTRKLLSAGGRQRSESTHMLGAMCAMTRLETVTETLRHVLNTLVPIAPDWVRAHTTPDWVDRYGLRASEFRLPKGQTKCLAWAAQIGSDGLAILTALSTSTTPSEMRSLPLVETLFANRLP